MGSGEGVGGHWAAETEGELRDESKAGRQSLSLKTERVGRSQSPTFHWGDAETMERSFAPPNRPTTPLPLIVSHCSLYTHKQTHGVHILRDAAAPNLLRLLVSH